MEYQKITKLLDTKPDNAPRFITKKWVEVHISQVVLKIDTNQKNK